MYSSRHVNNIKTSIILCSGNTTDQRNQQGAFVLWVHLDMILLLIPYMIGIYINKNCLHRECWLIFPVFPNVFLQNIFTIFPTRSSRICNLLGDEYIKQFALMFQSRLGWHNH